MLIDETNSLTVEECLNWIEARFEQADIYFGHGTDNAWDEAVAILSYVMGFAPNTDRSVLTETVESEQLRQIKELVARRIDERLPVAYLIKRAWFAGLEFYVDQRVIIPRSPIAEIIENRFQPWVEPAEVRSVLDLCTGSGCIAIAAASYLPQTHVTAVELSADAAAVAAINIAQHQLESRVTLCQGDLFEPVKGNKYDIIVSNPPYICDAKVVSFPEEYQHEPAMAFKGGEDGLVLVDKILRQAANYLTESGVLIVEVGDCSAALQNRYQDIAFIWLEFVRGGDGVFLLTKKDCQQLQQNYQK